MKQEEILSLLSGLLYRSSVNFDPPSRQDWEKLEKKFNIRFHNTYKELILLLCMYYGLNILNVSSGKTNGNDTVLATYEFEMALGDWPIYMIPIRSIGNGDYECLNSYEPFDPRVYYVYHDNRSVEVAADSVELWIKQLAKTLSSGSVNRSGEDEVNI